MAKPSIIRFSPGDWTSDLGIQALSYFERGIWFEILLKMHASPEIGKLMLTPETPVPDTVIASNILRIGPGEWDKVKAILLEYGVASTCPDTGALMCRRMVRDERKRAKAREHGKRGGNPTHKATPDPPPTLPLQREKKTPPPLPKKRERRERTPLYAPHCE